MLCSSSISHTSYSAFSLYSQTLHSCMVIFLILQFPQAVLKLVSVAVALPLADFLKQTVGVMRAAIEGETAVRIYSKHAHEVRKGAYASTLCTCTLSWMVADVLLKCIDYIHTNKMLFCVQICVTIANMTYQIWYPVTSIFSDFLLIYAINCIMCIS